MIRVKSKLLVVTIVNITDSQFGTFELFLPIIIVELILALLVGKASALTEKFLR